jgi:SAM-dependent methyltransferase
MPPLPSAVGAQTLAVLACAGALFVAPGLADSSLLLAVGQGLLAAAIAALLRSPPWWLPIHAAFLPAIVLAGRLDIAPAWYLGAFVLTLAVFWRTDQSRVPLYLSNRTTADALLDLLPTGPCRLLDLGCGDGALLQHLARQRPDCQFVGIEHAPLTWAWARFRCRGLANCRIIRGDFWGLSLAGHDVVYAFLSPFPMARLWQKAADELDRGARLISNSFPIPEVPAEQTIELPDRRHTRLYCYRPAAR